jgi:hypothetical protein
MPKFICRNGECPFFEEVKLEDIVTYRVRDGKVITMQAYCPSCNSYREEVKEDKVYEKPTYEAVGLNSNRRNWSKSTREGMNYY